MPFITVRIQDGASSDQKRALLRRLTDVTTESLQVPAEVVRVAIEVSPRDCFAYAGKLSEDLRAGDDTAPQIPFLIVRFAEGFSAEQRSALIAGLSRATAEVLNTNLSLVKGIFEEVRADAWANGGMLLSDLRTGTRPGNAIKNGEARSVAPQGLP